MTSRRRLINSTLALGALVGAGLLMWAINDSDQNVTVPPRPQMAAIHATVDRPAAEPLPRIEIPELTPQPAPEPRRTGTSVDVAPASTTGPGGIFHPRAHG